ncbi:MAG: hypothetical protein GY756_20865 [bacterium]|nr:hypothetical protein [bacterium]
MGLIGSLLSSKLSIAFLSEHQDSDIFNEEEKGKIRKYIPWTRKAVNKKIQIDDELITLRDYTERNKNGLVIKYTESFGGKGIFIGKNCSNEIWSIICERAFTEPFWIVQELLKSQPLLMLQEKDVVEFDYVWGSFVLGSEYCGSELRMVPFLDTPNVINGSNGAEVTVVLEV